MVIITTVTMTWRILPISMGIGLRAVRVVLLLPEDRLLQLLDRYIHNHHQAEGGGVRMPEEEARRHPCDLDPTAVPAFPVVLLLLLRPPLFLLHHHRGNGQVVSNVRYQH